MIRKVTFLGLVMLAFISSGFGVSRSFAKARLTEFEEVDAYINSKMKGLAFPARGDRSGSRRYRGIGGERGNCPRAAYPTGLWDPFASISLGCNHELKAASGAVRLGKVRGFMHFGG